MGFGGTRARSAGCDRSAGGGRCLRLAPILRGSPWEILVGHNDAIADHGAVRGPASAKQILRSLNVSIPVRQQPMRGVAGIEPLAMALLGSQRASGTIVPSKKI